MSYEIMVEFKEIEEVITIDWEEREQAIDPKDFVSAYDEDAVYLASNFEIMLVNVEQPLVISAISQEDRHTFAKKEYRLLIKDEKDPVIEYHGPKVIKHADMNDFRLEDYLEVYDIGDTTAVKNCWQPVKTALRNQCIISATINKCM